MSWKCPTCGASLNDEGKSLSETIRTFLVSWEEEGTRLRDEPEYDGGYGDALLRVVKVIRALLN
jgi:hypothetical protein